MRSKRLYKFIIPIVCALLTSSCGQNDTGYLINTETIPSQELVPIEGPSSLLGAINAINDYKFFISGRKTLDNGDIYYFYYDGLYEDKEFKDIRIRTAYNSLEDISAYKDISFEDVPDKECFYTLKPKAEYIVSTIECGVAVKTKDIHLGVEAKQNYKDDVLYSDYSLYLLSKGTIDDISGKHRYYWEGYKEDRLISAEENLDLLLGKQIKTDTPSEEWETKIYAQ